MNRLFLACSAVLGLFFHTSNAHAFDRIMHQLNQIEADEEIGGKPLLKKDNNETPTSYYAAICCAPVSFKSLEIDDMNKIFTYGQTYAHLFAINLTHETIEILDKKTNNRYSRRYYTKRTSLKNEDVCSMLNYLVGKGADLEIEDDFGNTVGDYLRIAKNDCQVPGYNFAKEAKSLRQKLSRTSSSKGPRKIARENSNTGSIREKFSCARGSIKNLWPTEDGQTVCIK